MGKKKLTDKQKAKQKYMREYMKEYYKKNRNKMVDKQKEWNKKNKEKVNEYQCEHRANNMEEVRKYYRHYHSKIRSDEKKENYEKLKNKGDARIGPRSVEARKKVRDGIIKAKKLRKKWKMKKL